jgi:hypothetical protein
MDAQASEAYKTGNARKIKKRPEGRFEVCCKAYWTSLTSGDREDERVAGLVPLLRSWSRKRAELSCWTEPSPMQALPWFWWTLLSQPALLASGASGSYRSLSPFHELAATCSPSTWCLTRIVGHVAVRREEGLRERFRGVQANAVAASVAACRKRGALGSVSERRGSSWWHSVLPASDGQTTILGVLNSLESAWKWRIDQGGITDIVRTAAVSGRRVQTGIDRRCPSRRYGMPTRRSSGCSRI